MKLLLVRHAIAEDAATFVAAGGNDAERPLTEHGRKRMNKAVRGLRSQLPQADWLVHSPLLRARETAGIIANALDAQPLMIETAALDYHEPPQAVLEWLKARSVPNTAILVGHEPQLSLLTGLLLCGEVRALIPFRKGGVALIAFADHPSAGQGVLQWALTPRQLRQLRAS